MPRIVFPEFRDETGPSKYPFADRATLVTTGGVAVEPDLFLDARLYPVGGKERQYLAGVTVSPRQVTLTVGDAATPVLAQAKFDPLAPPDLLELSDPLGRPAGVLVSEAARLAVFQTWAVQEHKFAPGATEFVASCVTPMPEVGVRGFVTDDGALFTGDVWIVGEDGVVVREGDDAETVRIDVVGDPLFRRRLCQPVALFTTPRFVRTINGMKPDARGDFKITVGRGQASDPIIRVFTDDSGAVVFEAVGQTLQGVQ